MSSERDRVDVSITIAAPRSAVWVALTAERDRWWPGMTFDPIVGALLREVWTESGFERVAHGRISAVERNVFLAFDWTEEPWPVSLSVRVTLDDQHESTRVTVTETGFDGLRDAAGVPEEHRSGWRYHLANLERSCRESQPRTEGQR